jgi:hypothetical protein
MGLSNTSTAIGTFHRKAAGLDPLASGALKPPPADAAKVRWTFQSKQSHLKLYISGAKASNYKIPPRVAFLLSVGVGFTAEAYHTQVTDTSVAPTKARLSTNTAGLPRNRRSFCARGSHNPTPIINPFSFNTLG